ncbi:DUF1178 family protein [Sphingomonas sp. BIUV-7]|uniref:DUF1178 family protein n=1 Tax=Sphingomonas natans TaxID=3063330 RepID=A0ABT8Y7B4_9SPHN|nr:DUF1178 family protein [Sphingomonas sp. BIUV-7]MDO6413580.1 DUF1178 family protein [Sphingomonas sp. BIUV-7]
MIVFDLQCDRAHVFEAWFGSTEDYEGQRARGLVSCPLCGSGEVAKAVMAPNVAPKGNQLPVPTRPAAPTVPVQGGMPAPAQMKAMLSALAQAQAKALEGSEHVGKRFAEEARAIHDGDAPERVIHGEATPAEAKALAEDGVAVSHLPFPVVPPGQVQ